MQRDYNAFSDEDVNDKKDNSDLKFQIGNCY